MLCNKRQNKFLPGFPALESMQTKVYLNPQIVNLLGFLKREVFTYAWLKKNKFADHLKFLYQLYYEIFCYLWTFSIWIKHWLNF